MKNVILITIDCLRADHLSCYGYHRETTPFIDSLANEGIIFRRAYANGPFTVAAFPAILTSTYPLESGRYITLENRIFVSEILREKGIKTAAIHSNPYLSEVYGYNRGFDYFEDFFHLQITRKSHSKIRSAISATLNLCKPVRKAISLLRKYLNLPKPPYAPAETITKFAIKWLKENLSNAFFLWLHYMDLHEPYLILNTGIERRYSKKMTRLKQLRILKPRREYVNDIINVYDDKLRYIDLNIQRLYNLLKQEGIIDETIIIITADHGQEFYDHGHFSHIAKFYEENIHIPLIIYGLETGISDKLVSQLDIAPTILWLYKISPAKNYKGKNLLSSHERDFVISEASHDEQGIYIANHRIRKPIYTSFSCITKQWKYILTQEQEEMYDLSKDPKEKRNVVKEYPEIASKLKEIVEEHIKEEERIRLKNKVKRLKLKQNLI